MKEVMGEYIDKQRTGQQNRGMWKFMTMLAESLNDAGLDMRKVLKPAYSIPWTKENIHNHLWIPIQKAMYSTESTTLLHKIEQVSKVHEVLMRELGEKHGIDYIPFPSDDEKHYNELK